MTLSRRTMLLSTSSAAGLSLWGCARTAPARPTLTNVGIYSAGQGSAFLPYAQGIAQYLS
jgi:hypothetical protein